LSPDDPGDEDGGPTSAGEAGPDETHAEEEVPRPTGEVILAPAPHSALVGLMAEPLSRSIRIRRSTVLMLVAFLGFGTLMYLYPPAAKSVTTSITTNSPNGIIPGLLPATTTTTTQPVATTTTSTVPPRSTSTTTTTTTTKPVSSSGASTTTTTRPLGSTTTTGSSTTTTRVGAATTTTSSTTTTATTP
jgi:hypothetical protein